MNIALILQHRLLHGLHRFFSGSAARSGPPHMRSHATPTLLPVPCPAVARNSGYAAVASRHPVVKVMPLRVLRVMESGMPRSSTGRMVISGRMADVCAELDRLVEREAALH